MSGTTAYPRYSEERLTEALADSPAVLIHGPRQSGKTTLARSVGDRLGYQYTTFDDDVARAAASADPIGFVADLPRRAILDEVQHVPTLFSALKAAIDRARTPGRFILTGSANVLLVPRLSDSLAGRMEILRLHPLSQGEIARTEPHFIDALFTGSFRRPRSRRLAGELVERVVAGGYPAALQRAQPRRRAAWYRNYVDALVERDVRDMSRISALDALPRLLAVAAANTAQTLNISELAAPFSLTRPTIKDYVTLLERVFLIDTLPPWHYNRLKRLVKTPKLHMGDTGLACALLGLDATALHADRSAFGPLLETFVFQELRRQASWHPETVTFYHFRDRDGVEVDLVLECGARVAGIEVKAAATVTDADFRGLRKLREATGRRFSAGVVLYDGETSAPFGEGLHALPMSTLWAR
ncbi:MAG: AAA family ATPase [Gemmatimonadetes bacterium SCN 70-22]|nr:MAG: AAA family ATPase [Gemmatimonadetes bacterium SCN 70-22]